MPSTFEPTQRVTLPEAAHERVSGRHCVVEREVVVHARGVGIAIGHALPLQSENRWSDMLAVLIATDPAPMLAALALEVDPTLVSVRREVKASITDRHDIVLEVDGHAAAVIEVKVLSGLGGRQLARYEESAPTVDIFAIVFPQSLVVDTADRPRWRTVTWEALLTGYAQSASLWVADTARAWLNHIEAQLPAVGAATVWNQLRDGEGFVNAMRARVSWVYSNLTVGPPLRKLLVSSSAGASSVVGLRVDAPVDGYVLQAEMEERMGVRSIPKYASSDRPPIGPSAWVGLLQRGVSTSADFDWSYLAQLWREAMSVARSDWVTNPARPRGVDRDLHAAMVALGGPRYLGVGFGDAQTKITGECMFGARIQLPGTITLSSVAHELEELGALLLKMRDVDPRKSSG
ncbi:MAG: hypothetical protein WAS51_08935 [Ilumatobacteraceae bacterium]|nr:MAG: hypothetical protein IPM43_12515 [Actinomycetota bacterium]